MATIAAGTITRLAWDWTGVGGAPYFSSLCIDNDASSSELEVSQLDTLLDDLSDYIVDDLTWTFRQSHEQFDVATGQVNGASASDPHSGSGTTSTAALPPANQILISFHTGEFVSGRELRGRLFLPGIMSGANGNGVVDPSIRADIEAKTRAALLEASGLNGAAVVYSRTHRVAAYITSVAVASKFAVLRSRRD